LVQAAADGDVAKVRELLAAGTDVNSVNRQTGDTALMKAAAEGHTALAVTLILLGADVNAQNKQGHTALMLAAENGRTATIRALFDLRQLTWEDDVEQRKAALRAFPGFDRALIADRDLDLADLKIEEMLRDENGETASIKALRADDPACFGLFTNDMDNQLARDNRGRNVAMHAAIGGRVDLFRVAGVDNVYVGAMVMFDFELSLSLLDNDGKSALQLAEEHDQQEIADILRAHFEAIVANQTREIEKGETNAEKHRRLRGLALQALGRAEQAQPDLALPAAGPGQELLNAAAVGELTRIRRLIAEGADVNAADPDTGETPLMRAAASGQSAAAVVLLMRRANEQARDRKRMTPLMHAVLGGHADLVQLLAEMSSISWDEEVQFRVTRLDAGLPADTDFKSMHFDAALEAQDENGESALMKAAARGDEEIVAILLRWCSNEAARDREGRTALMHAIAGRQTAFLKTMIDGAEAVLPHAPPGYNKSGFVSPEVLSVTDQDGKTALVLAREEGLEPVAAALQTYLQHLIDSETRGIEAGGPYLWYIYHTRGHSYLGIGQTEAGKADLAKARELNQQKP
jgi:ankyrin repeat protein